LPQYYAVGILYGGLPATVYGFFLGYLNVPGHVYTAIGVVLTFPWSFKFLIGMMSDCAPIGGMRRKPYICIGWTLAVIALLVLANTPIPAPYWCEGPDGKYITEDPNDAKKPAKGCNLEAANSGGKFALMMMMVAAGYMIADVAADGLTVEFARREPLESRGTIQTTVYLVRAIGQVTAVCFVAFFMNSYEYRGSWGWGLNFNQVMGCFAIPAAIMVPISWFGIKEDSKSDGEHMTFSAYIDEMYKALKNKTMLYVILYQFMTPVTAGINTTASNQVQMYWAGVGNFQNQLANLLGLALFIIGLKMVNLYFLNDSWRMLMLTTTVGLIICDGGLMFITVYDVVRNQYFFLGEGVLTTIPEAMQFVVSTFVIVEMASDGTEAVTYGLLTTAHNLGGPVGRALGNVLFSQFKPEIDKSENFIKDEQHFRNIVALSFAVSYTFNFLSLLWLLCLPDQKAETQEWKRTLPSAPRYAVYTLCLLGFGFLFSLTGNMLNMNESTQCMVLAGGHGC